MESHLRSSILSFVLLGVVVSHAAAAALSPEVYWDLVLPNTPMPKAILELLPHGTGTNFGGRRGVGAIKMVASQEDPQTDVGKGRGVDDADDHKQKFEAARAAWLYGSNDESDDKIKTVHGVSLSKNDVLADLCDFFFLEKNLQPGKMMNLHFIRGTDAATFLPRHVAEAIPFSSKKLPEIMDSYAVDPKSMEAEIMQKTIHTCEVASQEDEDKSCATSLESMVDFVISKLREHVQAISTEVEKKNSSKQRYTILPELKKMGGDDPVVCHRLTYAHAVFYCHRAHLVDVYKVEMLGIDGRRVSAAAVCHKETSRWNPKHMAFKFLNVKPGTIPICHFLIEDDVVWTSN